MVANFRTSIKSFGGGIYSLPVSRWSIWILQVLHNPSCQNARTRAMEQPDSLYADRVFFDGFNGVIKSDFIRDRFRFSIDSVNHTLTVNFTNLRNEWNTPPVTWRYEKPSEDSLHLWGTWKNKSLMMKCALRKEKLMRY